jgi:hypothetical protein
MGKAKSAARKLNPMRVAMAQRTARMKHELAMKMVAERVKTDAEFAADVLRIAGETLREEIKKDAHETIARANAEKLTAVNVDVPINVVDVPQEELLEALDKLSEQQTERLKAAGLAPIVGGDTTDQLVTEQTDGGGEILVRPTELPTAIKDGQ